MKNKVSAIWILALVAAALCLVFPPRRDTEQGRDREGTPNRVSLWSDNLYQGSQTSFGHLTARLDIERLTLELLFIATVSGAIVLAAGFFQKGAAHEKQVG